MKLKYLRILPYLKESIWFEPVGMVAPLNRERIVIYSERTKMKSSYTDLGDKNWVWLNLNIFRTGFLNFSTIDIWGWTILFRERGCPLNSKIFCSIPSLPSPTLNCNKQMYQKYPNAYGEQKSPPVEKYCSNTTNYCPTSFALVTLALPSPFNLNVTYLGKPFLPTTLGLMLLICLLMVFDNYLSGYLQWF